MGWGDYYTDLSEALKALSWGVVLKNKGKDTLYQQLWLCRCVYVSNFCVSILPEFFCDLRDRLGIKN